MELAFSEKTAGPGPAAGVGSESGERALRFTQRTGW